MFKHRKTEDGKEEKASRPALAGGPLRSSRIYMYIPKSSRSDELIRCERRLKTCRPRIHLTHRSKHPKPCECFTYSGR